jgi:argininosuccinate lyase
MSKQSAGEHTTSFVEGVGGRLGAQKSDRFRRTLQSVEGRANRYVGRAMLASDLAYVLSAMELGFTPHDEGKALLGCLLELLDQVDELTKHQSNLDILVQRESWVAERLPKHIAARLHFGRNRGESIRGYLPRLFFRDALFREREALLGLLQVLIAKAEPVLDSIIPVYHHLQHAGVTTLGEYLLAWVENLFPYLERLDDAARRIDIAPPPMSGRPEVVAMGEAVRQRLGFSAMAPLRQQIHVTEDQLFEPFFALVTVAVALARLSEDLRLYTTTEFAFFDMADEHASGSSQYPQKKNAFGLQAVIGSANVAIGRFSAQMAMSVSLSEELVSVFQAASLYQQADDIVANTLFMAEFVERGRFDVQEMRRKAGSGYAGAAEALDILMFEHDVPMRVAHHELGALVRALVEKTDIPDISKDLAAELGRPVAIDLPRLLKVIRGEEIVKISLNLSAVHASWEKLSHKLGPHMPVRQNPVDVAIAALIKEARASIV